MWGVLKVSAIGNGVFRPDENKSVTRPALIHPEHEVRDGDILLSRCNTSDLVGLACHVRQPRPGLLLCDKTLRLVVDGSRAVPRFIAWALASSAVRRQISVHATGTSGSMKNIQQEAIRNLVLPLPAIAEQHRIAEILDAIDQAIKGTEAVITKLRYVYAGILWDRISAFALRQKEGGDGGQISVRQAGSVQLGRQRSSDASHENGGQPYLRVANVYDGFIDTSDVLRMQFSPHEREIFSILPGDILLNEGQSLELVGRCAIYRGRPNVFSFQNSLVRFRCNESVSPEFMRAVFKLWLDAGRFMQIAKQTTSMAHLGAERFARMSFVRPPLPEQERVAAILGAAEDRIAAEEMVCSKLRLQKQGLMHDLLTGRVRVKA
jgi:type I restriction enzyme S subunit